MRPILRCWGSPGLATLYLVGDFDIATAPALSRAIDEALDEGAERLAFDARGVDFIDLRGVHPVLEARRRLRQLDDATRVWWSRPAPAVQTLLSATGLSSLLPVI